MDNWCLFWCLPMPSGLPQLHMHHVHLSADIWWYSDCRPSNMQPIQMDTNVKMHNSFIPGCGNLGQNVDISCHHNVTSKFRSTKVVWLGTYP